jgi:hypothetical protein
VSEPKRGRERDAGQRALEMTLRGVDALPRPCEGTVLDMRNGRMRAVRGTWMKEGISMNLQ